jgi:DNA polymerase (family 10)
MENVEIARVLNQYADLLEIEGADPFRVRAYRNAARTIESLSRSIAQCLEEGQDLKKLKLAGIGKGMTEHIEEIVKTGTLGALRELREKLPASLDELLQIEGLGPKRTKLLYEKLGIGSVKQLEQAIDAGKVQALPGFGEKSVAKIRRAIENSAKRTRRFKLLDADQLVRPLVEHLRRGGDIDELEVAGSYRRRMETVGDIDILIASDNANAVMERFQSYPEVAPARRAAR